MTVIINEFEVIPAAPQNVDSVGAGEKAPLPPSTPVADVERALIHLTERAMRVWAH